MSDKLKGIKGRFNSPINGDPTIFQLRIDEDVVTDEIEGMVMYDYNEKFKCYKTENNEPNQQGYIAVLVIDRNEADLRMSFLK